MVRVARTLGIGLVFVASACGPGDADERPDLQDAGDGPEVDAGRPSSGDDAGGGSDASVPPSSLLVLPGSLVVGDAPVTEMAGPARATVNNLGPTPLGPLALTLVGDDADAFELWGTNACEGVVLQPGGSCTVDVALTPANVRPYAVDVEIAGLTGRLATLPVSGAGYRPGYLTSPTFGFDFGVLGTSEVSAEHVFAVTNPGSRPVRGVAYELEGDEDEFVVWTHSCSPVTPAGATCGLGVRYVPKTAGPVEATLTLAGDSGDPVEFVLTGLGISTTTRNVMLSVDGAGTVTTTTRPARTPELSCTSDCDGDFRIGSVVSVHAVAAPGSIATGWWGACDSSTPTCTFTVAQNSWLAATFESELDAARRRTGRR